MNAYLGLSSAQAMIRDTLASAIQWQSTITGVASLADLGFRNETGWNPSKTMCSDLYAASCCCGGDRGRVRYA